MPRLVIRDCTSQCYQVDTTQWELVERWLREWMPRLAAPDLPVYALQVHPLQLADQTWDWPADARFINEPFPLGYTAADALTALHARQKEIEQQIREAAGDER